MFLSFLAEIDAEQIEKTTDIVQIISIVALAVLFVAVFVVCVANRKFNTRSLVYAAMCIAASFALSFIKIAPVQYGGSITLASFVPLLLYAYAYGPVRGLIAGLIYGILQFIQEPFILTPVTFILDYLLAFASIALMGFAKHFTKSTLKNVLIGTGIVYLTRFVMHLLSGIVYFNLDQVWADLPMTNSFVYSLIYQCVYIPADCAIAMITLALLVSQKAFDRLVGMMASTKQKPVAKIVESAETPETQETSEESETETQEFNHKNN